MCEICDVNEGTTMLDNVGMICLPCAAKVNEEARKDIWETTNLRRSHKQIAEDLKCQKVTK